MAGFKKKFINCIILCMIGAGTSIAEVVYCANSTSAVCQLTGDYDFAKKMPTLSQTKTRYGIWGTDLGISFMHKNKLYFLFGDTPDVPNQDKDVDCIAWSENCSPERLKLTFLTKDERLLPIKIPGISQGTMEVPTCGISVNDAIYIVHSTQWYDHFGNMERSVLTKSDDEGRSWKRIYDLSAAEDHNMANARFINVSMTKVKATDFKGQLPFKKGDIIFIWGSGAYRKSNLSLACVPAAEIENKSAIRYFSGINEKNELQWSESESKAVDLFDHPEVGEFSIKWIPQLKSWIMLYNCCESEAVCMRTAGKPWGPYSECKFIIDKKFIQRQEWKAAYGPYIVEQFTKGNAGDCSIYFTISSWEPYATYLMQSSFRIE